MIQDIQRLMEAYHTWLKDKSVLRQIDQWVEITTPYLDRHNDYLQIYAKRANGGFVLTMTVTRSTTWSSQVASWRAASDRTC